MTNPKELNRGLGGRECIAAGQVMLFEFGAPGYYPFWMKNMHFPIDIVWLDQTHKVVGIKKQVSPSTYPHTFVNKIPAQYVMELKAGSAEQFGLASGTLVQF